MVRLKWKVSKANGLSVTWNGEEVKKEKKNGNRSKQEQSLWKSIKTKCACFAYESIIMTNAPKEAVYSIFFCAALVLILSRTHAHTHIHTYIHTHGKRPIFMTTYIVVDYEMAFEI